MEGTTDVTFETFVDDCLVEDGDTMLPKSEVRALYDTWADQRDHDLVGPSWFSRKLDDRLEFTTGRWRLDGELTRVFVGFDIASSQESEAT